jgi:hypothetical protein
MKRSSGKSAYFAKHICKQDQTRMNKNAIAEICAVAVFMSRKGRIPGKRAFRRIRLLAMHIERVCDSFISLDCILKASELAKLASVSRIMDISSSFTEKRAVKEPFLDFNGDVLHSVLSKSQARDEIKKLPVGSVGVCIVSSRLVAFLNRGVCYDCIQKNNRGIWQLYLSSSEDKIFENDEDAEITILESI